MVKLAVGVPWQHEMMISDFFYAFFRTDIVKHMMPNGLIRGDKKTLDNSKNQIVREARELGADEILFLDADQGFPIDFVARLRSHNKDIVSGLVPMRKPPHYFSSWKRVEGDVTDEESGKYRPIPPSKGLQEVDAFGGGAMLVKMEVFDKLPEPWFKDVYDYKTGDRKIGQDMRFCALAQKYGYKLWMDNSCHCTHGMRAYIDYEYSMKNLEHLLLQHHIREQANKPKIITPKKEIVLA